MSASPQPGILLDTTAAPLFLVLEAEEGEEAAEAVAHAAARLPGVASEVDALGGGGRGKVAATVALGSGLWERLFEDAPRKLSPFSGIEGPGGKAVATGGDLFVQVHAERRDLAVEVLLRLLSDLDGSARVTEEVHGFRYLDSRDLTGFLLGTGNPEPERRAEVALVGDEDPEFTGGSYVLVQRYVQNLRYWGRLSLAEQEGAIGRVREDGRELPEEGRKATSHLARVAVEEEGDRLEIVRHGSPYATSAEQGLLFAAYARKPAVFDRMLARIYGTSGDGLHDRLMDFVTARSSALFFAPDRERLASLAG